MNALIAVLAAIAVYNIADHGVREGGAVDNAVAMQRMVVIQTCRVTCREILRSL